MRHRVPPGSERALADFVKNVRHFPPDYTDVSEEIPWFELQQSSDLFNA